MKSRIISPNDIFKNIITVPEYRKACRTDIYDFPRPFYKNIKDMRENIL
jgi:hypothetical protein